ncbi:helix-turn-helix domain-containing protein [Streptomyces sp. NPDC013171]|uniref:helix-turn-helix domain-containing protein n=1 Tax=Streptomyces sp. NPDC013171 TaxID=3364863 RepID=UPI00369B495F
MGRPENPIAQCSKSLRNLATWLRLGREAAGLTYGQLAARTDFSADTLARAASGHSVPQRLNVVTAYAQACGLSTKEAERLWKLARRDEAHAQGVLKGHRGGGHISVVKDFADLRSAIVDLYQDDGGPPLRSLDQRIGGVGRLPHSTVGRVLAGRSTPRRDFVLAFAEACGVRKTDLAEWAKAWDRADADRRTTRANQGRPTGVLHTYDRITPRDLQILMSDLEASARKEPGLKLRVAVPDPNEALSGQSARMTRELLVDQAQRRGELACPRCRRPSFGYDEKKGWIAALCDNCRDRTAPPLARLSDTPTLVLRVPASPDRAPLPRRVPQASWRHSVKAASPLLPSGADDFSTITDPPAPGPALSPNPSPRPGHAGFLDRRPGPGTFPTPARPTAARIRTAPAPKPLPRGTSQAFWPSPPEDQPTVSLKADDLPTITDPPAPDRPQAPVTDGSAQSYPNGAPYPGTFRTPTQPGMVRIHIRIPDKRPIPPVAEH